MLVKVFDAQSVALVQLKSVCDWFPRCYFDDWCKCRWSACVQAEVRKREEEQRLKEVEEAERQRLEEQRLREEAEAEKEVSS